MSSSDGAIFGVMILIYIAFWAVIMAASITMYVLHSLGMYTIAKRRGIANPFLAWIPVANVWILGSIADQYDEAVKGVKKKSRILLLVLDITMYVSLALFFIIAVMFEVVAIVFLASEANYEYDMTGGAVAIVVFLLFFIAVMILSVVLSVLTYIAYYKLFKSCRPYLAVIFLVLSIFVSFAAPICVFVCRKDDKGMPEKEITVEQAGI